MIMKGGLRTETITEYWSDLVKARSRRVEVYVVIAGGIEHALGFHGQVYLQGGYVVAVPVVYHKD